jgi:hypothetical protein
MLLSPSSSSAQLLSPPQPQQCRPLTLTLLDAAAEEEPLAAGAIPPAQSWFAQHYSPPTDAQKRYAAQLQRAQERKARAKLDGGAAAGGGAMDGNVFAEPLALAGLQLRSVGLQEGSPRDASRPTGKESSAVPSFIPLSELDDSAASHAKVEQMYQASSVARLGGAAASPDAQQRAEVLAGDAELLVVQQLISSQGTPANKARTLVAVNSAAARAAMPPGRPRPLHDVTADMRNEQVLSPTSRELQQRIDQGPDTPRRVGSMLESPRSARAADGETGAKSGPSSARGTPLPSLSEIHAAKVAKAEKAAERLSARRLNYTIGDEEEPPFMSQERKSGGADGDGAGSEGGGVQGDKSHRSSDDESEEEAVETLGGLLTQDPFVLEQRRRARAAAKAERKASAARTEAARAAIRAAQAAGGHGSHPSSARGRTPRSARGALLPNRPVGDASSKPKAAAPAVTDPAHAVVGGTTATPSWSNVQMSESLLYRVVHCMMGFVRRESDALRLLDCGALELLCGLINHPVYDLSYHALLLLTTLTTRFASAPSAPGEDHGESGDGGGGGGRGAVLLRMLEVLERTHLDAKAWLGISIVLPNSSPLAPKGSNTAPPTTTGTAVKTFAGSRAGFPWPTLDSLVSSCADFLRVDLSFKATGAAGTASSSLNPSPPLRDARSPLAFQLLVNLCQDPKGRGYSAVQRHSLWYENVLADVLAHPSLRDLEERQQRYARLNGLASTLSSTSTSLAGSMLNSPIHHHAKSAGPSSLATSPSAASLAQQRRPSGMMNTLAVSASAKALRPSSPAGSLMARSESRQSLLQRGQSTASHGTGRSPNRTPSAGTPSGAGSSTRKFFAGPIPRPSTAHSGAPSPMLRSRALGSGAGGVISVAQFGGHWTSQGGVPFDRHYGGAAGFPLYQNPSGGGASGSVAASAAASPSTGLDWELPSASTPGSTELLSLLSESQLCTQPVSLRVCDLKSCALVEHVSESFVLCPRCQQVAYCSTEHRRLAWRSWHKRVCSVTKKRVMKPGQSLRYPVHQVHRLHSGIPMGAKAALMRDEIHSEPAVTSMV